MQCTELTLHFRDDIDCGDELKNYTIWKDKALGSRKLRETERSAIEIHERWDKDERSCALGLACQRLPATSNPESQSRLTNGGDDFVATKEGIFYVRALPLVFFASYTYSFDASGDPKLP